MEQKELNRTTIRNINNYNRIIEQMTTRKRNRARTLAILIISIVGTLFWIGIINLIGAFLINLF